MKYQRVLIYTKKGNLLDYLHTYKVSERYCNASSSETLHKYYGAEREIQLIACLRWEKNKVYCKIKCPLSPIPVKGEFELPSQGCLDAFLKANGWNFKQTIDGWMFN